MTAIRNVNLCWELRQRGSYAVAPYALSDDGSVVLAMPRPMEVRSYDLVCLALPENKESIVAEYIKTNLLTFSSETLLKLVASPQSPLLLGMTADDIYLIQGTIKQRYLGDKHFLYADAALSSQGNALIVAYSDMSGTSFGTVYGHPSEKPTWVRESEVEISAVAVSPQGTTIVQGSVSGEIILLDVNGSILWAFDAVQPIQCIASCSHGSIIAYGTKHGEAGAIDSIGSRIWSAELPGRVVSIAITENGKLTAALCMQEENEPLATLFLLNDAGQTLWSFDYPQRMVSVALSPNGTYLMVSGRDGSHSLYQAVLGVATVHTKGGNPLDDVSLLVDTAQWEEALTLLRETLEANPTDVACCQRLIDVEKRVFEALDMKAREQATMEELTDALETYAYLQQMLPHNPEVLLAWNRCRQRGSESLMEDAWISQTTGDMEEAQAALLQAIECEPHNLEARQRLGALRQTIAQEAEAEAKARMEASEYAQALESIERALASEPTPERETLRQTILTLTDMHEGMAAYEAKRYREAIFQFKKILVREPNHVEANRYLKFAQRFDQDGTVSLDDRISRLE